MDKNIHNVLLRFNALHNGNKKKCCLLFFLGFKVLNFVWRPNVSKFVHYTLVYGLV